jgi:hypothetical protein
VFVRPRMAAKAWGLMTYDETNALCVTLIRGPNNPNSLTLKFLGRRSIRPSKERKPNKGSKDG